MGNTKGIAGRLAAAAVGAGTGPVDADPSLAPAPRAPRVRDELMTLEYPRHLHKSGDRYLRVENESEARAAVGDGWYVDKNEADAENDVTDPPAAK